MHESRQLIKLSEARRLLAECKTFDEAKYIADVAEAARRYAQVSRLGLAAQNDATEIKLRAQRLMGKMLKQIPWDKGGRPKKTGPSQRTGFPSYTLPDMGFTKKQSSHCQLIAEVSEDHFLTYLDEHTENGKELTSVGLVKIAREQRREAQHDAQRAHADTVLRHSGAFLTSLDDLRAAVATGEQEPFGCLYIDPPWSYQNQGTRASTGKHYTTLTLADLAALPVAQLAAPRAHLHLWTTNAFLFDCPALFAAWGFTFKSSFIWVKPQIGIGNYWRNAHEFLLLGVRGGQTALDKALPSWLEAPRTEHSAKPERIRRLIERLSPGPYLELFGRQAVDGWTVWGNECRPSVLRLFRGRTAEGA